MRVEMFVFLVSGAVCLFGALGVVLFRNPVHNALSLVATLFGVAVLFVAQEAYFLAAIQVIVYAGAIVVLFLFVIMLLGVDRAERLGLEPIAGQRVAAAVCGVTILGLSLTALLAGAERVTGTPSSTAALDPSIADVERLGRVLFTDYVFAFEITAVLLTIAVVGAVVLARRPTEAPIDLDEFPEGTAIEAASWDPTPDIDDAADGPGEDTAATGQGPRVAEEVGAAGGDRASEGPGAHREGNTAATGQGPRVAEEVGASEGPGAHREGNREDREVNG